VSNDLTLILQILQVGLSLWSNLEKKKYADQVMQIQKAYHAEIGKPETERSDAVLDNLEFQPRILCQAFVAAANAPTPATS